MNISQAGVDLIKSFESFRSRAYPDQGGRLTIGWGHAGADVPLMGVITPQDGERLLRRDLDEAERGVNALVRVPLNQNEFDALVSFTFNEGSGKLSSSTLLRLLNGAEPREDVAAQFVRWDWVRVNGTEVQDDGLYKRRCREAELFLTPPTSDVHTPGDSPSA